MKILTTISFMLMIAGCITESKVNSWLKDHPTKAAGYCADNYPPDTTFKIITGAVDTSGYQMALSNMHTYADSLFLALKMQRESFRPTPQEPCPPAVNLDSLRKAVDAEMRKRLTPCKDSIQKIVYTVVDKAREKQLQGKVDEKDGTITARDKRITELESNLKGLKKWPWLFWALVVLVLAGLYLNQKFKLLNKIKSYVN